MTNTFATAFRRSFVIAVGVACLGVASSNVVLAAQGGCHEASITANLNMNNGAIADPQAVMKITFQNVQVFAPAVNVSDEQIATMNTDVTGNQQPTQSPDLNIQITAGNSTATIAAQALNADTGQPLNICFAAQNAPADTNGQQQIAAAVQHTQPVQLALNTGQQTANPQTRQTANGDSANPAPTEAS
jgi:hypothetical protein